MSEPINAPGISRVWQYDASPMSRLLPVVEEAAMLCFNTIILPSMLYKTPTYADAQTLHPPSRIMEFGHYWALNELISATAGTGMLMHDDTRYGQGSTFQSGALLRGALSRQLLAF